VLQNRRALKPLATQSSSNTPSETFQHYVAQDAHFLHYYARAYAAAIDKAGGADCAEARVVLHSLLMGGA
jgi:thiaminase